MIKKSPFEIIYLKINNQFERADYIRRIFRISNIEYRISNIEYRISNIEYKANFMPNIGLAK